MRMFDFCYLLQTRLLFKYLTNIKTGAKIQLQLKAYPLVYQPAGFLLA